MIEAISNALLSVRGAAGDGAFLALTAVLSLALCFLLIPWVTDLMVGSAAGLASKYWGPNQRTMVINSSTNNPELFMMLVSLAMFRAGGIGTPLGSNFANIYLMFLVAPIIVLVGLLLKGGPSKFISLIKNERRLVLWHFLAAGGLFLFSSVAFWCLTGVNQLEFGEATGEVRSASWLVLAAGFCLVGILAFFFFERRLKRTRPALFEDISDDNENASWLVFLGSTAGLMACSGFMNAIFLAWTEAYETKMSAVLGAAIFTGLHYFLGALVTSLPEVSVAIANLRRLRPSDLNTALGSASYSNMSNLAIAAIGALIAAALLAFGAELTQ